MSILGVETNYKELTKHGLVNFFYGLAAGLPVAAVNVVTDENDIWVFVAASIYYQFLSEILNRKSYSSWLGKRVVFGFCAPLGWYVGYKIIKCVL